jgi:uncharacterized protein YjbI with pentapeptide repeats
VKIKLLRWVACFLFVLLGWFLGYVRIPDASSVQWYWLGVLTILILVSLIFVQIRIKRSKSNLSAQSVPIEIVKLKRMLRFNYIILVVAGVIVAAMIGSRSEKIARTEGRMLELQAQNDTLQSMLRDDSQAALLSVLLSTIKDELSRSDSGKLSVKSIKSIEAVSNSFIPYWVGEDETGERRFLSPERGQLLLALYQFNLDSQSLKSIKNAANFEYADLRFADLRGQDLSGMNMRGADLSMAKLDSSNFDQVDLRASNLNGVSLRYASAQNTDFTRASMRFALLNQSLLDGSILNGVDLSNAQLIRTSIRNGAIRWSQLEGALFNGANISQTDCYQSSANHTSFIAAQLIDADFRVITMKEGIITDANFHGSQVEESWPDKLHKWEVIGDEQNLARFKVVKRITGEKKIVKFHLESID